jgi:hypothetical protein
MARRKAKRTNMNRKTAPSVLTMAFTIPDGTSTVDLSQCASLLNRRFYRQGINWVVSGFRVFTPTPVELPNKGVVISRLPNTWSVSNSWEKGFSLWNKQQMDALAASGSEEARAAFRDYKIHMDETHVTDGFSNNLKPTDSLLSVPLVGEWEASEIVIPNFTAPGVNKEFLLHMVGANTNAATTSRGMIEGYAHSRSFPQSPDPVSPNIHGTDNWMREMFDVGEDTGDITLNATTRNDELPYDQVEYPGSATNLPGLQVVDAAYFSAGTNSNKLYLKGDNFPCGLIRIISTAGVNCELLVDLVPGYHKGYLCQKMADM